jgi:hypothetical protein
MRGKVRLLKRRLVIRILREIRQTLLNERFYHESRSDARVRIANDSDQRSRRFWIQGRKAAWGTFLDLLERFVASCARIGPTARMHFVKLSAQGVDIGVRSFAFTSTRSGGKIRQAAFNPLLIGLEQGGKVLLNGDMTVTVSGDAEIDGELIALRESMARPQRDFSVAR